MTTKVASDEGALLRKVVATIHDLAGDAEIILFGSRAQGRAREDSDFDFLVIAETDDRYALMIQLARELQTVEELGSFDVIVIPRSDWERVRRLRGFIGWEADQHGVRLGA